MSRINSESLEMLGTLQAVLSKYKRQRKIWFKSAELFLHLHGMETGNKKQK